MGSRLDSSDLSGPDRNRASLRVPRAPRAPRVPPEAPQRPDGDTGSPTLPTPAASRQSRALPTSTLILQVSTASAQTRRPLCRPRPRARPSPSPFDRRLAFISVLFISRASSRACRPLAAFSRSRFARRFGRRGGRLPARPRSRPCADARPSTTSIHPISAPSSLRPSLGPRDRLCATARPHSPRPPINLRRR